MVRENMEFLVLSVMPVAWYRLRADRDGEVSAHGKSWEPSGEEFFHTKKAPLKHKAWSDFDPSGLSDIELARQLFEIARRICLPRENSDKPDGLGD